MAVYELDIKKSAFNETFYPLLKDYTHRWEVYLGSAGSGKSHFITQKLIIKALSYRGIRLLVCRRYGTTIRQTVFELFKQILTEWGLLSAVKINESDYRIFFPNGSQIIFTGLDEETKLLSLTNVATIWVEEAYEVPKEIIDQLNLRLRGKHHYPQLILSFNPISIYSWLYEFINNPPASFIYHHSTYLDNKFLPQDYIDSLEDLKVRNPQKARIFCYGEWGMDTDGLVFTNWRIAKLNKEELAKKYEHRAGLDMGWNDPTAVVESFYDRENRTIYITDEFYKTGQTLEEIYKAIMDMKLNKVKLQCDSAEPRVIDYFRKKGIYAVPCIKGANSVYARISFLQDHTLIIDDSCVNVIKEVSNFSYVKDKQSGKFVDGKYTHEYSHAIDGLGYSYSDIYTKGKLKSIDKSILGL